MTSSPPKRRNATTTRETILVAARLAFATEGYDQVGVRDIAAAAGVDPALIKRYFGSKDQLFAEVVQVQFDLADFLAGDRQTLGLRLAEYLVGKPDRSSQFDALLALLRSAHTQNDGLVRNQYNEFNEQLEGWLEGAGAKERAHLIFATIAGFEVLRRLEAGSLDVGVLTATLGETLQAYVTGREV